MDDAFAVMETDGSLTGTSDEDVQIFAHTGEYLGTGCHCHTLTLLTGLVQLSCEAYGFP